MIYFNYHNCLLFFAQYKLFCKNRRIFEVYGIVHNRMASNLCILDTHPVVSSKTFIFRLKTIEARCDLRSGLFRKGK